MATQEQNQPQSQEQDQEQDNRQNRRTRIGQQDSQQTRRERQYFEYGSTFGAEGARYDTKADDGTRWSPYSPAPEYWRIGGRRAIATALSVSYDTIDLDVLIPADRIEHWREAYTRAGDMETIVGAGGEFRTFGRAGASQRVRVQPPEFWNPEPFEPFVAVVSAYDDNPAGGGTQYFEGSISLTRTRPAGPRAVPPTPNPRPLLTRRRGGWGGDGWGEGPWGDPTDPTIGTGWAQGGWGAGPWGGRRPDEEAPIEDGADSAQPVSAQTPAGTDRPPRHRSHKSTTAMLTGNSPLGMSGSDSQRGTVGGDLVAQSDGAGDGDGNGDGDDDELAGGVGRPHPAVGLGQYGHAPPDTRPDEWGFGFATGEIVSPMMDAHPFSGSSDAVSEVASLSFGLDLDSGGASTLLTSASHLDAVSERAVPDGNNVLVDGAGGRNTVTISPPEGIARKHAIPEGVYVIESWTVSPRRIREWTAEIDATFLWPVPA